VVLSLAVVVLRSVVDVEVAVVDVEVAVVDVEVAVVDVEVAVVDVEAVPAEKINEEVVEEAEDPLVEPTEFVIELALPTERVDSATLFLGNAVMVKVWEP